MPAAIYAVPVKRQPPPIGTLVMTVIGLARIAHVWGHLKVGGWSVGAITLDETHDYHGFRTCDIDLILNEDWQHADDRLCG